MRSRPSQSLETRDDEEVTDEKESGESEGSTSSVFSDTDSGIWDGNEDQDDEGLDQNDNHESMEYVDEEEREEGEEQEAEHEKLAVKENAKPSVFRPKPSKCNINPDGDGRHATPLTTKPVGGAVSKEVRLLLQKRDKKHAISIKSSLAEANNYWHYSFDHLNRNVLLALKRRLDRLTVKSAETKDKNFTTTEASSMDTESLIDWDAHPTYADDMNIPSSLNTTIDSASDHNNDLFRESDEHGSGGYGKGEVVEDFLDRYYAAAAAPSTITKNTGNRDNEYGSDGRPFR